jgi:hypothetical protein
MSELPIHIAAYEALADKYRPEMLTPLARHDRFVLVERSARDTEHFLTPGPDPESLLRYAEEQEDPESFEPVEIVELATGDAVQVERRFVYHLAAVTGASSGSVARL